MNDDFTFGVEEEFFVVDARSCNTLPRMPRGFLAECTARLGDRVTTEMLQSQIETATGVCRTAAEARSELREMRHALAAAATAHHLAVFAAGTHPLAEWSEQRHTDRPRYDAIMDELAMIGLRNLLCGLHVHVAVPDPSQRVLLMARLTPWLPLLLALSTSSPFWGRRRTGLLGYRLAAYDELPRTGLPPSFAGEADYRRYRDTLVEAGVIEDASYFWWSIRPSLRFPTLELRIADSAPRLDDALAVASLFRALVARIWRDPGFAPPADAVGRAIAEENRWRAQRYGIRGTMVDARVRRLVPTADLIEETIALVEPEAEALGCLEEVRHARRIVAEGTAAHAALELYDGARLQGTSRVEALRAVIGWLARCTAADAPVSTDLPGAGPPE